MSNVVKPAIPSIRVLRFLRCQAIGASFFTHGGLSTGRHPSSLGPSWSQAQLGHYEHRRHIGRPYSTVIDRILPSTPSTTNTRAMSRPQNVRTSLILGTREPSITNKRYASTNDKPPAWWDSLMGLGGGRDEHFMRRVASVDCNDDDEAAIFKRRSQAAKAALEPRIRCTIFDEKGDVIQSDSEYKKTELIAQYGLQPRDLRKIDSSSIPHIFVRESAILLNLLHLKVLIQYDRVLVFDAYGSKPSFTQKNFMADLQDRLRQVQVPSEEGGLPYELRALEAVLISVASELENELHQVQDPVLHVLSDLEEDIDRDKLRVLLILSKKVSVFEQKAELVRKELDRLMDDDDDVAELYLTSKAHNIERSEDELTEVEMLLESYHKIFDEVYQESSNLSKSISNTEEISRAILDANRNSLMLLDLKFSVGTLGLAMGTFIAGLFGMNLTNYLEQTTWGFAGITSVSVFLSVLIGGYGLVRLRKVQRVGMLGGPRQSQRQREKAYLYADDGPIALLDARDRSKLRKISQAKSKQVGVDERGKKLLGTPISVAE